MDYEYGTGQQGLNYPNPYRLENLFLGAIAFFFYLAAAVGFVIAKADMGDGSWRSYGALVCSFAFLGCGLAYSGRIGGQVRVYFGRGQPKGLSPEMEADAEGATEQAGKLKESIRQGALFAEVSGGAMNGFVYGNMPELAIAPKEVQDATLRAASNLSGISTQLAVFALAEFFTNGQISGNWIGLYFALTAAYWAISPILKGWFGLRDSGAGSSGALVAVSILASVGLATAKSSLPYLGDFSFWQPAAAALALETVAEAAFFLAMRRQLTKPSGISTFCEQRAISFNANPSQLALHAERELQKSWTMSIPNRIYARIMPKAGQARTGGFRGQIIQESQPVAEASAFEGMTLEKAWRDDRRRWLLMMDFAAAAATLAAISGVLSIAAGLVDWHWTFAFFPMFGAAWNMMNAAHSLWGRFDFESKIYVFEIEGAYSAAEVSYGNYLQDRFQSRKEVVSVDSMTLRVWVTLLKTCVFGHGLEAGGKTRKIIGMIGLPEESKAWSDSLESFAKSQSVITAPSSVEDLKRAKAIGRVNSGNLEWHEEESGFGSKEAAAVMSLPKGESLEP